MNNADSPLGHIHKEVLLRALHETRDPEPTRLLVVTLAVRASDYVSHQCPVTADGNLLRRNTEAADDRHARQLAGRRGAEAACEGAWRGAAEGVGEHFTIV